VLFGSAVHQRSALFAQALQGGAVVASMQIPASTEKPLCFEVSFVPEEQRHKWLHQLKQTFLRFSSRTDVKNNVVGWHGLSVAK
jgi:hypothetical protein